MRGGLSLKGHNNRWGWELGERFNLCAGLFAGTITKRGSQAGACYLRGAVAGIVIKLV